MKVLVTGAEGMLGRDVMLAAGNAGHDVVGFGRAELDVTDADRCWRRSSTSSGPTWSSTAPPGPTSTAPRTAEEAAFAVNGTGAGNVAAAAAEVGAAVVYVSTDYVFDGAKGAPYVESDQPAPLSAYGRTKLAGEEATAAANKRHFVVRSAWLFGIGGRNFVETMLRLAGDQNEVLVVRDQVGSPTYTWHLAYGIVRLIEGIEYGIHHMAAAGQLLLVRVRPRDLRAGQGRVQSALDHHRGIRPARRRGRPSRPWPASASTRSGCPPGRTGWPATSPNDEARGGTHEAAGHRRRRIHRLHLRPHRRRRARDRRARQAHLRRPAARTCPRAPS